MKTFYNIFVFLGIIILTVISCLHAEAGNKDRSGQAGASELLINPFPRASGLASANSSRVRGLEAIWGNVAGTAFTKKTEFIFANTQWLKGTGTNIFNFGLTQRLGEDGGVLGLNIMSMNFGDIDITTVSSPEGGLGTFSPNNLNIALSYARAFSNSIYAGLSVKVISESISNVNAQGIALDAGIQYVTGDLEQMAFGISLKNVGPTMRFSGDGLTDGFQQWKAERFEIPTQLNIGVSYDINFEGNYVWTWAFNFVSNSFTKDQFILGTEINLKDYLMLRAGYAYEDGINDEAESANRTNVQSGLAMGASVQVPFSKEKGSGFSIDYSYRQTAVFNGNHTIGARFFF